MRRHFSPAKNVYACSGKNNTWFISGNVIGSKAKIPAKCCWDERSDGSLFWQWLRCNFLKSCFKMCIPFLCQNSTLWIWHSTTFDCCLLLVSYLRFSQKKVEGQTFLGFVLLVWLSLYLLLEKLYLDAKSPCVYTVYGRKISLRLVQLNLGSLGTKGNYKEGPATFWLVKRNSVYNVHSCCTFGLAILELKDRSLDYFAHKFGLGSSTLRVTCYLLLSSLETALTNIFSPVYKFLVLNICTQGFAWKLDPGRRWTGWFFVFLSIVCGLIFLEQSYEWMIELTCY